jgi:hypothetical protein
MPCVRLMRETTSETEEDPNNEDGQLSTRIGADSGRQTGPADHKKGGGAQILWGRFRLAYIPSGSPSGEGKWPLEVLYRSPLGVASGIVTTCPTNKRERNAGAMVSCICLMDSLCSTGWSK